MYVLTSIVKKKRIFITVALLRVSLYACLSVKHLSNDREVPDDGTHFGDIDIRV